MDLNQSQLLIIGFLVSLKFGLPNIEYLFTQEIINVISQSPNIGIIILVSLLKIFLLVLSMGFFIVLGRNIIFTYQRHPNKFDNYMLKLVITFSLTSVLLWILI